MSAKKSEARAAMSELVTELDRTRKEFAKATLQLTHLESSVQLMKDAELKKDQVIAHLESELARRDASYTEELSMLQEEARSKEAAFGYRVKHLEMEVARLRQEAEAAAAQEKENRQLRDAVLENQATIEKLQQMNEALKAQAKEDVRDHAAQLETEFKKRLAESEKKFRAEAYRALSEEAKIALQGNDHLQTVLQRQNDSIEAVLLKCKRLEQAHASIANEQELSAQTIHNHVAEIDRLKKQLGDVKQRNEQLEDNLRQRKVERASLELLYIEFENGRRLLSKEKERSRRALRDAERWRNRCIQLTQELTEDQREAAEAKLAKMAQRGAELNELAARSRKRAERAERTRQRNAAGAALLKQAGGATPPNEPLSEDAERWSNISTDDDAAIPEDAHGFAAGPSINPADILAMWNTAFAGDAQAHRASGRVAERGSTDQHQEIPDETEGGPHPVAASTAGHEPAAAAIEQGSRDGSSHRHGRLTLPGIGDELPDARSTHHPDKDHARGPTLRVDQQRMQRDIALSVLSHPKQQTLPAPARPYAVQQNTIANRLSRAAASAAPRSELVVVSHGWVKKREASKPQFLVP